MYKPRVVIVDTALDELPAVLRAEPSLQVVAEAQTVLHALALVGQFQPDVLVLNVNAVCTADVELVADLNQRYPHLKLMLISANQTPDDLILEAYRQGARAYLSKTHHTLTEIVGAVHALYRGESVLNPQLAGGLLDEIARARGRRLTI